MFRPFHGDNYGHSNNALGGLRVLILGESHWSDTHPVGSEQPDMTEWVIQRYLDPRLEPKLDAGHKRTLTKMGSIAARTPPNQMSADDRQAVWHSLAFYNYIPVVAASGASQPIPEEFWHDSAVKAFRSVLRTLEVEAILVCGRRLWDGMGRAMPAEASGTANTRRYPTYAHFSAAATYMHHPAAGSGWTFERWRDRMDYLIAEAAAERQRLGAPPLRATGPTARAEMIAESSL